MNKTIKEIPTLSGKEADKFGGKMLKEEVKTLSEYIVFAGLSYEVAGRWEDEDFAVIRRRDVKEKLKDFYEEIDKVPNIKITHTTVKALMIKHFGGKLI